MERSVVNKNLAQMLKGGVIMDVTNKEEAIIAEKAGACAVMALERVPSDIRKEGGVARMSDPKMIKEIQEAVSIPVMAKVRIGHFVEAQILEALNVDFIENIILFIPLGFMYNWAYHDSEFLGINKIISKTDMNTEFHLNNKISPIKKTLFSLLLFSFSIECTQLMLKIGIFQLSDIFCNTVGGALGTAIYILGKQFIGCKNR